MTYLTCNRFAQVIQIETSHNISDNDVKPTNTHNTRRSRLICSLSPSTKWQWCVTIWQEICTRIMLSLFLIVINRVLLSLSHSHRYACHIQLARVGTCITLRPLAPHVSLDNTHLNVSNNNLLGNNFKMLTWRVVCCYSVVERMSHNFVRCRNGRPTLVPGDCHMPSANAQ